MALPRLRARPSFDLRVLESIEAFNLLDLPANGYAIAKELGPARRLVSHGRLYAALHRCVQRGLLETRWELESPEVERPPRCLYRLTPAGSVVLAEGSLRSVVDADRSWLASRV